MNPDTLDNLVGDVPVSEQLGAALERMAPRNHIHSEYATHDEVADLKRKVEMLMDLVGDTSVAEQISAAIRS
jgi:hypothetical protein